MLLLVSLILLFYFLFVFRLFFFCFVCFCFVFCRCSPFVLPVLVTYEYVHEIYFNCCPALGLGPVNALTLTDFLLIDVFF